MQEYYIAYMIGGFFAILGMVISGVLKRKFNKYSQVALRNGMSGREVAEKMLADNAITDVKVISVRGKLTDHYNPFEKTVNLSESVYHQRNAAAAAVAAHEAGHAVQHAEAYRWLTFRSRLVPTVSRVSSVMHWILLLGVVTINSFPSLLLIGIVMFAMTTLFSFVTLPVEFDASRRALAWMRNRNVVTEQEYGMSKDSLRWAAMTYVSAALGSLAILMYYVMVYIGGSRR